MKILLVTILLISGKCFAQGDTLNIQKKYWADSVLVNGKWQYNFTIPEIPVLQNQVNNVTERVKVLENKSTLVNIKNINQPTYTISLSDAGTVIECNSSCVITFSNGLPVGFSCRVIQSGGTVSFSGNTLSTFGWKKIQTQNGYCDVLHIGGNKFRLTGNLKL